MWLNTPELNDNELFGLYTVREGGDIIGKWNGIPACHVEGLRFKNYAE